MIKNVKGSEVDSLLAMGKTVVYITAAWCGPCRGYGPQVESLSEANPDITFLKIDADDTDSAEFIQQQNVRGVPHTTIYEDGEIVDHFSGADIKRLTACLS